MKISSIPKVGISFFLIYQTMLKMARYPIYRYIVIVCESTEVTAEDVGGGAKQYFHKGPMVYLASISLDCIAIKALLCI